jgi:hypothetical protein
VFIPTLMLMALHEERVRDLDRQAFHADLRSPESGHARSSLARPWPSRVVAALSARAHAGPRRAGLATARAQS